MDMALDKAKAFIHKVHKYKQYMVKLAPNEQQLTELWHGLIDCGLHAHGFRCTRSQ